MKMEITRRDETLVARDVRSNIVRVPTTEWVEDTSNATGGLERETDAEVSGTCHSFVLPDVFVACVQDGVTVESVTTADQAVTLDAPFSLTANASIRIHVRLQEAGPIQLTPHKEEIRVSRPDDSPLGSVTIGFSSRVSHAPTLEVPQTVEGVATALSWSGSRTEATSPDRSWPSVRERPPRVEWGEETKIPEECKERNPETGIEIVVDESLGSLLDVSSLAYYLNADVSTEAGAEPYLNLDGEKVELDTANDLLRRVFWFDCLARSAGPHQSETGLEHLLDELDLDAARLYDAPLTERISTYQDANFAPVAENVPEWHLALSVDPTFARTAAVIAQLDNLPLVHEPRGEILPDILRTIERPAMVDNETTTARTHGWLADRIPVTGYKLHPDAVRHASRYTKSEQSDLRIAVVRNDYQMSSEFASIQEIYASRAEELGIELVSKKSTTVAELARIFEGSFDLVHLLGHCTESGIQCRDGSLDLRTQISSTNVETFCLNACGTYRQGQALVERGSVAGIVTTAKVMEETASEVGMAWSRLMMVGWPVEPALRVAQHAADVGGTGHLTLGDGTYVVTQNDAIAPSTIEVEPQNEKFKMTITFDQPFVHGTVMRDTFLDESHPTSPRLAGNEETYTVTATELRRACNILDSPLIVKEADRETTLKWPEEQDWI
jgi:hypothetical protein